MKTTRVQRIVAGRIRRRRTHLGMGQADLAQAMGFASRQTLSQIERMERPVSAGELVAAVTALGCSTDELLDTMRLDRDDYWWSCRASEIGLGGVPPFRGDAERLVGLLHSLRSAGGSGRDLLRLRLHVTERTHDDVLEAAAESVWHAIGRPATPAVWLEHLVAAHGLLDVIDVDAPTGVVSGLVLLPELRGVLVNRHLDQVSRADAIAQALFRALTWPLITPPEVESLEPARGKRGRGSRMAARFAATLLAPATPLLEAWSECADEVPAAERCLRLAGRFRVPPDTLGERLVSVGAIDPKVWKSTWQQVSSILVGNADVAAISTAPSPVMPLFGSAFLREISVAIDGGHLSVRRAARLLGLDLRDLGEHCRNVGAPLSYDFD